MTQIICEKAILGYDNNPITKEISFSVNRGDYLSVVGENGSGKSSLIKTILGLLHSVSGKVEICNHTNPIKIGYLPQHTELQKDFPASVLEVVLSGCITNHSLFSFKAKRELALRNLERLGISDLQKHSLRDLSGGQKQKVFLARALSAAKDILLLDEPVTGLDPSSANEMYEILYYLNKTDLMSIIMVSHDIKAAVKYSSHILHIGDTNFFGTTEEYKNSNIGQAYISIGGGSDD